MPPSIDAGSGGLLSPIRVRLDLGYDGTGFSGWAAQPGRRTVEATLVLALQTVFRVQGLRLVVAGRTDAGVHATGQVCHLDVPHRAWEQIRGRTSHDPASALLARLAGVLPDDIRVHGAAQAPPGFDARFSAVQRRYRYRISDHPWGPPPLRRRDVLWSRQPLDVEAMDAAAGALAGLHDFAAFCKRREGATTVRTLLRYQWRRDGEGLVVATVEADAFCHSMVRSLVGALLAVGEGRKPVDWPGSLLTAESRASGVTVAPAHGLVLTGVDYPPDDQLAARAELTRNVRTLEA